MSFPQRRSSRDIKTLAGRGNPINSTHRGYMRITYLEVERTRLQQERANVERNLKRLEERLSQIAAEKETLLRQIAALDARFMAGSSGETSGPDAAEGSEEPGLRLRY